MTRANPRSDEGFTLIELLVVATILVILVTGLTEGLVSALHTQVDQTTRAQGQQDARLALDKLRREIHCATSVVFNSTAGGVSNVAPTQAVTITLGSYCPSYSATSQFVTWCTSATSPYTLWRYPHTTDPGAAATYATACANTGQGAQAWVKDIDNGGSPGITAGKIFTSYTPPVPAGPTMDVSAISTTTGGTLFGPNNFGYIVDPVVSGVEQPGTEVTTNLLSTSTSKAFVLDWSIACANYPAKASITGFKVYGRAVGAEQLLTAPISSTACATTTYTDTGGATLAGTPVRITPASIHVDIPVRAKSTSSRLTELQDDIVLRNTPR